MNKANNSEQPKAAAPAYQNRVTLVGYLGRESAAKPPDETVFFIDRSLGIEPIRSELVNAGLVVEIHDDHFPRDEEDRVWLRTSWRARLGCAHQGSAAEIPSAVLHSVAGPFVARVSQSGHVKVT